MESTGSTVHYHRYGLKPRYDRQTVDTRVARQVLVDVDVCEDDQRK